MRGQATLEGGTRTTHTYTKSKGSGNGVSLFASTGRFAKNATRVALDNVNNDGHISGQIRQISGNNSGYNSPHIMSGSEATGSGISLYSDTFNAQIPRVETRLGKINNRGSIRGDATLKAGDLSIDAHASGNGISVYQATGNAALTSLGSVNNEGIIQSHIETRAGTVFSSAQRGQTIPEERAPHRQRRQNHRRLLQTQPHPGKTGGSRQRQLRQLRQLPRRQRRARQR